MVCSKCGAALPEDAKFCIVCGTAVRKTPAEAQPEGPVLVLPADPDTEEAGWHFAAEDVPAAPEPPKMGEEAETQEEAAGAEEAAAQPAQEETEDQSSVQESPRARPVPFYARSAGGSSNPSAASCDKESASRYEEEPADEFERMQPEEPVSMGEWLITMLLTILPVVNLVMLCIWAFGRSAQPSKRNWARAALIMMSLGILITLLAGIPGVAFFTRY